MESHVIDASPSSPHQWNPMACLHLVIPALPDLWFRQEMMADADTMSYNEAWGGTIPFPPEQWPAWYDAWVLAPATERYYRCVADDDGYVGEMPITATIRATPTSPTSSSTPRIAGEATVGRRSHSCAPRLRAMASTPSTTTSPSTTRPSPSSSPADSPRYPGPTRPSGCAHSSSASQTGAPRASPCSHAGVWYG